MGKTVTRRYGHRQKPIYCLPTKRSVDLNSLENHALLADPTLPVLLNEDLLSTPKKTKPPPDQKKRTPLKGGLSLLRLLKMPMLRPHTNKALKSENQNGYITDATAEYVLNTFFPRTELPASVDDVYDKLVEAKMIVVGNKRNGMPYPFVLAPILTGEKKTPHRDVDEVVFAKYCNEICAVSRTTKGFRAAAERDFTGRFSSLPLQSLDGGLNRKPDLIIVKRGLFIEDDDRDGFRVGWLEIGGPGELKKRVFRSVEEFLEHVSPDMCDKFYCIFESQENRRYIIGWSRTGQLIRISVADHSAILHSLPFDYQEHPKLFIHLILGLAFASNTAIGYDPTFEVNKKGERFVYINEVVCVLKQISWRNAMIRGRATTVYYAMWNGIEVAIKMSWPVTTRHPSEIYFLQILKKLGIKNVPELLDWEDVVINGQVDSTDNFRGKFPNVPNRVNRRVILRNCGVNIWYFVNRDELISAYINIVETHLVLIKEAKILHADISITNLMLVKQREVPRKGMLIDFDYSVDLDPARQEGFDDNVQGKIPEGYERPTVDAEDKPNNQSQSNLTAESEFNRGQRTGTAPFMACELLYNEKKKPTAQTDLESFFYCLLYMASMYRGPNNNQVPYSEAPGFIKLWFETTDLKTLGYMKSAIFRLDDEEFDNDYLTTVTPYFNFLKPCLRAMRTALMDPKKTNVTHEHWLALLDGAKKLIPSERSYRYAPDIPRDDNRETYELFTRLDLYDDFQAEARRALRSVGTNPEANVVPGVVSLDPDANFVNDSKIEQERAAAAAAQKQSLYAISESNPLFAAMFERQRNSQINATSQQANEEQAKSSSTSTPANNEASGVGKNDDLTTDSSKSSVRRNSTRDKGQSTKEGTSDKEVGKKSRSSSIPRAGSAKAPSAGTRAVGTKGAQSSADQKAPAVTSKALELGSSVTQPSSKNTKTSSKKKGTAANEAAGGSIAAPQTKSAQRGRATKKSSGSGPRGRKGLHSIQETDAESELLKNNSEQAGPLVVAGSAVDDSAVEVGGQVNLNDERHTTSKLSVATTVSKGSDKNSGDSGLKISTTAESTSQTPTTTTIKTLIKFGSAAGSNDSQEISDTMVESSAASEVTSEEQSSRAKRALRRLHRDEAEHS